jgi:starch synthase
VLVRIVFVSAEVAPYAKTGGLADVAGALPSAVARAGHDVSVITPLYRTTAERVDGLRTVISDLQVDGPAAPGRTRVLSDPRAPVPTYFIEQSEYFVRDGIYQHDGADFGDNAARFAFLCRAALAAAAQLGPTDVFHCNDWHTALIPGLLKHGRGRQSFPNAASVLTIHNLAYQGSFGREALADTGLPAEMFDPEGYEFWGRLNFLKGGILLADKLTTVSPSHAEEILRPEGGHGLDAVLRHRAGDLVGVMNGIDTEAWDPSRDPHIPANFDAEHLEGKRACKRRLLAELGVAADDGKPVIGFVSRLVEQKGLNLVVEALRGLRALGVRLVVHGEGDPAYHAALHAAQAEHPDVLSVNLAYSEAVARRVKAGSDMMLMPSRFEPGGLTPIYGMRYGSVPVVRGTGGLRDSVRPFCPRSGRGNGFVFYEYRAEQLLRAVRRAAEIFRNHAGWREVMRNAMHGEFSWRRPAEAYVATYGEALEGRLRPACAA